ncbi:uncharacterized protein BDR25DRAFT_315689 [Lindgomyces ingoldianus]|uniref:Uncharacterized protein n=1 Tax=Lindgomyces ingoldianus TaxID=673940 RepID=A0ACB6QNZ8_9PLEO|nr:uncharacterized protein BDR25DRAFT_315689 [Lindgomyces ingoldianus]KAF2468693.1 hypothetical protein BDR25DRAFT_315689 [Lindgomyces ingoldianus]
MARVMRYENLKEARAKRNEEEAAFEITDKGNRGRMLVDKGAEMGAQGGQYSNALHAASSGGHEATVKTPLNKEARTRYEERRANTGLTSSISPEGEERMRGR